MRLSPVWLFGLFLTPSVAQHPTPIERVPGEWVLTREDRSPWTDIIKNLEEHAEVIKSFGPGGKFALLRSQKSPSPRRASAGKVHVQPNFVYAMSDSSDPEFEKSWGLKNTGINDTSIPPGLTGKDIGASDAWATHTGTGSVVVSVIDTGIDEAHEDLRGNLWVNLGEIPGNGKDDDGNGFIDDIHGWNVISQSNSVRDDNNHGTFCSGIIGAEAGNNRGTRGINWRVQLMAVKFLDANGFGTTANAISAIEYSVKNGAKIINASWGGGNFDQALYDTVKWAADQSVLFVAASGNDGKNNDTESAPTYPASFRLPNIISVAAYNNRDELASFSNFGKETVHLGAPGVAIYSTMVGGYRFGEGTSYAAPFVTGTAALLKSYVPELTWKDLKDRLLMTSEVIDYYQKEKTVTAGRIHAYNALLNIRPARPTAPSHWTRFQTSISSPHPYVNNTDDTYHLEHRGASHLRVHFASFDTEAAFDKVVLKDRQGRMVNIYSGELGPFWSADALGDTLDIEFVTDYVSTRRGFDVDAYEVSFGE